MEMIQQERFPKIHYDAAKIALDRIFSSPTLEQFNQQIFPSEKTEAVYGPLRFPQVPTDRPYLYASMVTSLDGKIAFEDDPEGPLIAQMNKMDPNGGSADFWLLNMLRSVSDASMGSGGPTNIKPTSKSEKLFGVDLEGGGHVYDQDLENDRIAAGMHFMPWGIITSLDCSEIGFSHPTMQNDPLVPTMITTSPNGLKRVKSQCKVPFYVMDSPDNPSNILDRKLGIPVVVTGKDSMPDARMTMKILRELGFKRILIEGPTYCHHLIQLGMLDELFLNYSCIYVGGKALSLGMRCDSFTSCHHPHTEMLSIHTHGPHFFYLRHKMIY